MPRNSNSSTKRKMDLGEDLSSLFGKRSKTSSSSSNSTVNRTRSRGTEEAPTSFNQKKCIAWFRQYSSTSSPDTIGNYFQNSRSDLNTYAIIIVFEGPEGVEIFCRDLDVEPENVALLVLSWKMGAKQMGYFTLQEWLLGLTDLQ